MSEKNKAVVRRLYEDIWNKRAFAALPEVLAEDVRFRGAFDIETTGIEAFREYTDMVAEAFPDFRTVIGDIVAEGSQVAVKLTYSGTHEGEMFGIPPTGKHVDYPGAAFFTLKDNRIIECVMIGDLVAMLDQLLLDGAEPTEEDEDDAA